MYGAAPMGMWLEIWLLSAARSGGVVGQSGQARDGGGNKGVEGASVVFEAADRLPRAGKVCGRISCSAENVGRKNVLAGYVEQGEVFG